MTEQEIVRLLSTIKMKAKSTVADETWGKALQLIEQLQSENAALKERLEKAIELPFYVFDKKTGKEADTYEIVLNEDWAKHLMYCDIDGFAIEQDTMWTFLAMGGQKGNPEILNYYAQKLLRMAKQKNAGQKGYAKNEDISFDLIDPIKWGIICEAVALCLDERFPKVLELFKETETKVTIVTDE